MTISAQTSLSGPYAGNDSTTVFAYAFKVLDEDHLVVTLESSAGVETVQTITTHYTVSGVGDASGGNVTMVTPPATGETLTITRNVPKTQETDLLNRRSLAPEVLEAALDKLTQIAQDYARDFDRTILTAVSSGISGLTLPDAVADQLIGWNGTADGLKNFSPNGSGYISVTATTDNALARYDGTGGVGFQNSGVIVDDSDNVTGINNFTVDGDITATTGDIYAQAGTAAAPSFSFVGDTDTGFYRSAANTIGFTVNGATIGNWNSSGLLIGSDVRIAGFLDEDTMSSDSATKGATQQSIKAYVDAQIAAIANQWTVATAKTVSSGTTSDYTSLPTGIEIVIISLSRVTTNGTSGLRIELGHSAGTFQVTGYISGASNDTAQANDTTAYAIVQATAAADTASGVLTLTKTDDATDTWTIGGTIYGNTGANIFFSAGDVSLGGELDAIRLTTLNGTDAFDATPAAGKWQIKYMTA